MTRRVVVTGIGMVTPLGHDTASTWAALLGKQSGIRHIQSFDASAFPTTIAAEVLNYSPPQVFSQKILKQSVPCTRYALGAAEEAFQDAGIKPTAATAARWGAVIGSGMMTTEYAYWQKLQQCYAEQGEMDAHEMGLHPDRFFSVPEFAKTQGNIGLALLSQHYGIRGFGSTVHTACASGGQALGMALQVIRRGDADAMLAGGYDSMINPFGLSSFCLLGAMSTSNAEPSKASRPFDYERNGFVLGEGAAFLILEEMTHAKARGAKIYAELAGEGNSLSSYRITDSHPSGDGAIQAIQQALADAGVSPEEVGYINAHGTSTKMNDLSETNAIKAVYEDRAKSIPVSSTKSQTGHLIAAAGALEGAITTLVLKHGIAPMTMNLETPDPECDLDYITDDVRQVKTGVALSHSFGFGGSNSAVLFKQCD